MTDSGDPRVYEWAERELARIKTLDESEFSDDNATRLDEKKKQLRKVLSFRDDGGGGESSLSSSQFPAGGEKGGEPPKLFPSDSEFEFDSQKDTKNEIVFGGQLMEIARELRLELFEVGPIVSRQELVEEVFKTAYYEVVEDG